MTAFNEDGYKLLEIDIETPLDLDIVELERLRHLATSRTGLRAVKNLLLRVIDPSTSREYFLRVPREQKTVCAALAWTFKMDEADYSPVTET